MTQRKTVATNRSKIKVDLLTHLNDRSIYWLAKESGVPYATVHKIARNKTDGIRFLILERLADALGCDPRDLIVVDKSKRD